MKYSSFGAVTPEKSGAAAPGLTGRIVDEINTGGFGGGLISSETSAFWSRTHCRMGCGYDSS